MGDAVEGGARFTFWLPVLAPGEHEVTIGGLDATAEGAPDVGSLGLDVNHVTVPTGRPR